MTESAVPGSDPRAEIVRTRQLARRVRRAQRMSWFPLTVFAVVTFIAIPVNLAGHPVKTACRATPSGVPGEEVCLGHNSATFVYWPIALVMAYIVIAAFYARESRARGVGTRVRPYVIVGVVLAVALTTASIWASHRPPLTTEHDVLGWHIQPPDFYRFIAPACAIGIALLVLCALERSLALLAVTVLYIIVSVAPIDFGWTIRGRHGFVPDLVIPGGLLLVAALGFAAAQRPRASTSTTMSP